MIIKGATIYFKQHVLRVSCSHFISRSFKHFETVHKKKMSTPPPPLDDPTKDPLECPPLRWGLIGCGRISHDFTQALKILPTQKVVACSARSVESAKAFADKHEVGKYCK